MEQEIKELLLQTVIVAELVSDGAVDPNCPCGRLHWKEGINRREALRRVFVRLGMPVRPRATLVPAARPELN